jgi:hypothetical protein
VVDQYFPLETHLHMSNDDVAPRRLKRITPPPLQ